MKPAHLNLSLLVLATTLLAAPAVPAVLAAPKNATAQVLESFEMYCFETHGKHKKVEAMAAAMKLKPIPKSLEAAAAAEVGAGKAYVIRLDKAKNQLLMLGISDMDACSINAQGFATKAVISGLVSNYQLKLLHRDSVGLSVREMHVPGAVRGTKAEAKVLGIVMMNYEKSGESMTIGYMPPETVRKVFVD